jgi:hypothetical protein
MRAQPLGAVLSVSIDLPVAAAGGVGRSPGENETAERLVKLFAAVGHGATWFADEPGDDAMIRQALAADGNHEAALRIDAALAGEAVGRNRLTAEIVGRIARARRADLSISTISIPDAGMAMPTELLVKQGITAVRGAGHARAETSGPESLRYGLWRIGTDCRVVGGSRIADWKTTFGIRRAIDRCIRNAMPLHLAVDVAAIAANSGPERLGGLPAVLRHVERRRSARALQVCTIAEVVARLAAPALPRAAGSILRAA